MLVNSPFEAIRDYVSASGGRVPPDLLKLILIGEIN
jgi:hypothetical protein